MARLSSGVAAWIPWVTIDAVTPGTEIAAPPPPGPPALVDLAGPRANAVMTKVRRTLATFGDPGIAMRRAADAAATARRIMESSPNAMGAAIGLAGRPLAAAARLPEDRPLWILGDVRGDALALAAALAFIDEADGGQGQALVAMLGDWCGGAAGDAAAAAMVLERFLAAPERTLLLRGDREWLVAAGEQAGLPATPHAGDMAVGSEHQAFRRPWLDALASLVPSLPVAAILPDGTLLTHGAVPRPPRLLPVAEWSSLQSSDAALRDFAFGRLHTRDERVDAGDREGGFVAGTADFAASLAHLSRLAERPLRRVVRGQDAAPEGHRWLRAYGEGRVLTLTTMADPLPEGSPGGRRYPCVARLKGGRLRVVQLDIPQDTARLAGQLFPPPMREAEVPDRTLPERVMAGRSPSTKSEVASPDTVAGGRREPAVLASVFERGVRLLRSRDWSGSRDAFREAAASTELKEASLLNQATACLWLGAAGHQEALACLRQLRSMQPRCAEAHFGLGIAFLAGEGNPSEATRSLRTAVEIAPDMADAWWALGLAAAMRHDTSMAATAFARAAQGGCVLSAPALMHGGIPTRERSAAMEALRGLARCRPSPGGSCETITS
jgi:hypothetical protein